MSLITKLTLVNCLAVCLALVGCKSTSQQQMQVCKLGINLTVDPNLDTRGVLDFVKLEQSIKKRYLAEQVDHQINLKLVKAYVRQGHLIIKATAVVKDEDNNTYYRASDVDSNLASADSEYQSALRTAVSEAIDKVVVKNQHICKTNKNVAT